MGLYNSFTHNTIINGIGMISTSSFIIQFHIFTVYYYVWDSPSVGLPPTSSPLIVGADTTPDLIKGFPQITILTVE